MGQEDWGTRIVVADLARNLPVLSMFLSSLVAPLSVALTESRESLKIFRGRTALLSVRGFLSWCLIDAFASAYCFCATVCQPVWDRPGIGTSRMDRHAIVPLPTRPAGGRPSIALPILLTTARLTQTSHLPPRSRQCI